MEPLRIGFVGGGEHARMSLYPSLRAAFGGSPSGLPALVLTQEGRAQPPLLAKLVALSDHKRELAERIATFHAVDNIYTDHREMIEAERPDAVIVCMHPNRQWQTAIDCLEMGVHVWVEKPPAESIAHAEAMAAAAKKAGKTLAVGYMKRFSKPYQQARGRERAGADAGGAGRAGGAARRGAAHRRPRQLGVERRHGPLGVVGRDVPPRGAEYARLRSVEQAWPSAIQALKAALISYGIELTTALLIAIVFLIGAWVLLTGSWDVTPSAVV